MTRAKDFSLRAILLMACMLLAPSMMWADKEIYVEYSRDASTLTFRYDENRSKSTADATYSLPASGSQPAWRWNRVEKVVFDDSFKESRPVRCTYWFYCQYDLTEIDGIENLNTDSVNDFSYMFYHCDKLAQVDLSGFNTSNVTSMYCMFYGCESLTELDLTSFRTPKVDNMSRMFWACPNLKSVDLSTFNTQKVNNMAQMFYLDTALVKITTCDLFVTDQVSSDDSEDMFYNCRKLPGFSKDSVDKTKACYAPEGYFTKAVPSSAWVEYDDASTTLTFHNDNARLASTADYQYDLPTTDVAPGWLKHQEAITKVVFDESFKEARPVRCTKWFYNMTYLSDIEGLEYLNTSEVIDMDNMFDGCCTVTRLDLSGFNTENVTSMGNMFFRCHKLESLDLTSFDTEKVTNMEAMFMNCEQLDKIYVSDGFVTDQVTSSEKMFYGSDKLPEHELSFCDVSAAPKNLTYLAPKIWVEYEDATQTLTFHYDARKDLVTTDTKYDLPEDGRSPGWVNTFAEHVVFDQRIADARPVRCTKWFSNQSVLNDIKGLEYLNTDSVTDMSYMFYGCKALTRLDLSTLNTANVTTMSYMFCACESLTDLDLSPLRTSKVEDLSYMFSSCKSLKELDLRPLSTSKVSNMSYMFAFCRKLERVDMTGFSTENATLMTRMFDGCYELKELDLSSFRTSKVTDMTAMFSNLSSLTELDLFTFDTQKVTDMEDMFLGDSLLTRIYVSDGWVVDQVTNSKNMFGECSSLPHFTSDQLTKDKAHYKDGGYLTLRRQFSVGEKEYTADGWGDETTCYEDVAFPDDEVYSSTFDFSFAENATASYTRTVKNRWSTLCLPFAFNADDNNTARFYKVSQYDNANLSVTALTGTIAAGTPVLAYTEGSTISVTATGAAVVTAPANATDGTIQGVFAKTEVGDNDYIIANDHFWNAGWLKTKQSANGVYVAPYRAYLTLTGISDAKPNSISIAEGETDGIERIDGAASIEDLLNGAELYDLQGRRLSAPQRGVMIIRKGSQGSRTLYARFAY